MIMPRIYEIDQPERAASYIHEVQMQVEPRLNLTIRGETSIRHQRSIERVERTVREQLVHYLGTRGTGVPPRLNLTIRGETSIRHQRSIEHVDRILREQLVHSLSARGTRIDAVTAQGSPTVSGLNKASSPGMRADLPLARPVSRVVRRPVAEPAITDRALTAETLMMLPGQRPVVVSRTNPPAPAPIDVNRLTDQVIQAIDRRIVAQRERLGRI